MTFIKLDSTGTQLPDNVTNHAMVQDTTTGLIFAVRAPGYDALVTQAQAAAGTAVLDFAGHADWRLPTPQELFSIVKFVEGGIVADLHLFPDTQAHWYWTSQDAPGVADHFFAVYFCQGHVGFLKSRTPAFFRPVRSGAVAA